MKPITRKIAAAIIFGRLSATLTANACNASPVGT